MTPHGPGPCICMQVFYNNNLRNLPGWGDPATVRFEQVLHRMVRTGNYAPHAHRGISTMGRGIAHLKAQAMWLMYNAPQMAGLGIPMAPL